MPPAATDLPAALAAPARLALTGAGIKRLADLRKLTEAEVKALHGIGPNALKQLRAALAAQGLALKPDNEFPRGIGRPATNALAAAGVTNLKQLTKYSEAELLALHGVGPKAVRILRDTLTQHSLSFRKGK